MKGLPIAIVGAGTAGLASALLLARQGFEVHLLERVPALQAVGAGVLLQPSGLAVLRELGLLTECTGLGAPVSRLFGTTAGGRVILDTRYAHWQPDSYGMGIHRSVLLHALHNAAQQAGVRILTGMNITRFSQQASHVQLYRQDEQGTEHPCGEYGALILADGVRSTLRAQMQVRQAIQPYPWGALWSIVPTPAGADSTDLRQWYRQCSQMFGVMPTGRTHHNREQRLSSLFWSLPVAQFDACRQAGLDAWKQQVLQLAGEAAEPFLAQVERPEQLSQAVYADVRMRQWHDGRVIAIGDCAHAMSPQLGQGVNMALVDAAALDQVLRAAPAGEALDWPAVFAGYAQARRDHLRYYRQASRLLTPLFQSHSRTLAVLRDTALYLARHSPFGRQHAVSTLIGARTGWLLSTYTADSLAIWREDPVVEAVLAE
ncbi:NAD(P)/FAD-dependent oxidoreductase [Pseudomonas sp. GD03944]|uniref:FAD-dependent oxidoreductase n=1 Tax=Pseudomonas sp. GD03944 TaxID=2975409 RepID=UPI00244AE4F0|nr:NAD(P)/FAD-dependent oxidoreductase [Pseudomonas sp. GD03944]MDH1264760.1 FAD-dependent monooxygenase [Pseudomonas sp. GD03944]